MKCTQGSPEQRSTGRRSGVIALAYTRDGRRLPTETGDGSSFGSTKDKPQEPLIGTRSCGLLATRRRMRHPDWRISLRLQSFNFCRKHEITFGQSIDLMSPNCDLHFAPREVDVWMMLLAFGQIADAVGKGKCVAEIFEREL